MAPDKVWLEHEGHLSPGPEVDTEMFDLQPRPDSHSAHPVCRRPVLWKLVAWALLTLGAGILGLAVWGATIVADQRVNDSKHQQLEGTLQELRQDVKELLRRSAAGSGKMTADAGGGN